ncbi:MAG: transcription antitermination factor NusB [Leadbetterella sp.]
MLNRRLVRIRVMQTLYALDKSEKANYLLAQDLIEEQFAPDLNAVVREDRNLLTGQKKIALSLFEDQILNRENPQEEDLNPRISKALRSAKEFLKLKNNKDKVYFQRQIVSDAEGTYELYLYIFKLIVLIRDKFDTNSNFSKNRLITAISKSKVLEFNLLKRGIDYTNDASFISKATKIFLSNPHVEEYNKKINVTTEEDIAIFKYCVKNIVFKNEEISEYFEKQSLYWGEDTDILRTMIFHSVNDFADMNEVRIEELDGLWEETKSFMSDLFTYVVDNTNEIMSILLPKLKNWELDRVIDTDLIVLKMAVAELKSFPSIPVKVTINEIVEISKNYGSEKSGSFVNGLLDGIVKELQAQNQIKKSGRGMLDNK